MALREYTDGHGMVWTAWSVSSDALHPANRSEEFLRQFASGWLCFESAEGEKRRLIDYPEGWEFLSDEELGRLCDRAVLRASRWAGGASESTASAATSAADAEQTADEALASAEMRERRRSDLAPPPDHPLRRREDRPR